MKFRKSAKTLLSLACAAAMLASFPALPSLAVGQTLHERLEEEGGSGAVVEAGDYSQKNYEAIQREYAEQGYTAGSGTIRIDAGHLTGSELEITPESAEGRDNVLRWEEENDYLEFTFTVETAGLYALRVSYMPVGSTTTDIMRALTLDGESPFEEAGNLQFRREWRDVGEPLTNNFGDEVKPNVEQVYRWRTTDVYDAEGMYPDPLEWYLSAGEHTLRLTMVDDPMLLEYLEFYVPEAAKTYAEVLAEYQAAGYTTANTPIRIEAESDTVSKSHSVIRQLGDSDPSCWPSELGKVKMNTIGGTNWQTDNASITWEFHAEESGLYKIVLRLRQNFRYGLPSYRRLEIDGEVPYEEFKDLRFSYNRNWRTETLTAEDGQPYYVYLEAGDHTLTMTAKQGEMTEMIHAIQEDSETLSDLILQIVMITGQNPDPNYDYQLEARIPGLTDTLNQLIANVQSYMDTISRISGGTTPSLYSQFNQLREQMQELVRDVYYIPTRIEDLNNVLSVYGDNLSSLKEQALTLDYIELLPTEAVPDEPQGGFWRRLQGGIVNFINSFTRDYNQIGVTSGDMEVTKTLDVWIARGKDWGTLTKQLADEDFTPQTGIGINLHVVPSGQLNSGSANALLLAVSSGLAPDIAMATPGESIAEFAIRNAVVDLRQFDDFEEVRKDYNEKLFLPVTYRDGVYGLPETINFKALFYRTDIFANLGLAVPETWEDLYNRVIPVLFQNNMEFYYPKDFDPLIYQNGASYYNEDLTASGLDTPEAYQAFKEICELFTVYGVPLEANFFNRFRTGEIPIGVADFSMYMQLKAAAPEINGRWSIAVLPGHVQEDGTINHSQGAALQTANMILSQTDDPDACWEFLKWWMSDSVQAQFGNEIEAQLGETARWNSANQTVYEAMAWPLDDLEVIRDCLSQIDQTPAVLGGYFTSRHLLNAFNRVCVSNTMDIRDSLEQAVKDVNKELQRRQESYNVK